MDSIPDLRVNTPSPTSEDKKTLVYERQTGCLMIQGDGATSFLKVMACIRHPGSILGFYKFSYQCTCKNVMARGMC